MGVFEAQRLLTAEEFWDRYADERVELIEGKAVEIVPNSEHSDIAVFVVEFMAPYVRQHKLGRVKVEAHYQLDAYTMRVADVSFLSAERQAQIPDTRKYIPFAPELVIEVISPNERASTVRAKMADYRSAGTEVMWLIYPDAQEVEVHYLQEDRHARFGPADTLRLEAVLPGFELALAHIFVE